MACVACEHYEKRITNIFRDEVLKKKYEKLIGFKVTADCFICDNCKRRLLEALKFQQNCIKIYKKNNPNHQQCKNSLSNKTSEIDEPYEEQLEATIPIVNDEFAEYKFNDTEPVFEDMDKQNCSKTPKNEIEVHKCVIIEKQTDPFLTFQEDQNNAYRADSPTDYSQLDKRPKRIYTVKEKFKLIKYAEEYSNREAARKFGVNESTIRFFRKQKARLTPAKPKKKLKIEHESDDSDKCLAELL
ncbi:uncharacterized protein [Chironomus tepperi]|uniref:uncharacterized protein n=1 Tax=Chironomus tepperi TaxID=113505 RepID=UPI00391F10A3